MRTNLAFLAAAAASLLTAPVLAVPIIINVVQMNAHATPASNPQPVQWTGTSFTVVTPNEPVPGLGVGNTYTVGSFAQLAPVYVDRGHRYTGASSTVALPSYLVGQEYIMNDNDNRFPASYSMDVTVSSAVTAYLLVDNRLGDENSTNAPTFGAGNMQWVVDEGWVATSNGLNRTGNTTRPDEVGIDETSTGGLINNWFSVYSKEFSAGTFTLLEGDGIGVNQNMYGLVVVAREVQGQVVPEPGTLALGLLGVAGLAARRRRA